MGQKNAGEAWSECGASIICNNGPDSTRPPNQDFWHLEGMFGVVPKRAEMQQRPGLAPQSRLFYVKQPTAQG